ncbi:hypothetical protein MJO28_001297 [Puccinia striiformis f. sp. tritici]|uniref:Uncharacterized protein n=2 Tax=Puccinia striiformis f. sp. tritici TaxID=168172 RepID=A0A0L0VEH9_9BASI|nr:hypothetical protein MJO28_001297 [Puccinia striiformis f. sp. tritici]KNE97394.1 hypothetical protein PSTG_09366 [Puccinia striiformis f. sp. tritici PST-78]
MADSEVGPATETGVVVMGLDDLIRANDGIRDQISLAHEEQENHLTMDDMKEKIKLLDILRSGFLASLHSQATSFAASIGYRGFRHRPPQSPDLGSILKIASNLHKLLNVVARLIEKVALESPLPAHTDDQHLKICKRFRILRLGASRTRLVDGACNLLMSGAYHIKLWAIAELNQRNPMSTVNLCHAGTKARIAARECHDLIDSWHLVAGADDGRRREDIAQVANSTIPLIKLARIFLYKISGSPINNPLFTLDEAINTENLELLLQGPITISNRLNQFAGILWQSYRQNERIPDREQIRIPFEGITKTLESTLLLLAYYLIPLPQLNKDPQSETLFKIWSLDLQGSWVKAKDNLLDVLLNLQT